MLFTEYVLKKTEAHTQQNSIIVTKHILHVHE